MQPMSLWQLFLNNPEWALVVVGILTIFVIGWQAVETRRAAEASQLAIGIMERQTKAAEDAAIAARTNAEAFIASERARVVAELRQCALRTGGKWYREDGASFDVADILTGKHLIHKLAITNLGRTPAEMFNYEIRLGPLIEGSPYSPNLLPSQTVVNLNDFLSGGETRVLQRINIFEAFNSVLVGKEKGAICIILKYGDIITGGSAELRKEHATQLLYYYDPRAEFPLQQITAQTKYT